MIQMGWGGWLEVVMSGCEFGGIMDMVWRGQKEKNNKKAESLVIFGISRHR